MISIRPSANPHRSSPRVDRASRRRFEPEATRSRASAPPGLVERARVRLRTDAGSLLFAAAFLLLGALWLGSSAHYQTDERLYTDAAQRMLASGDWLTPEYADGALRLNKPLMTYWVLIASYATFGVSLLASRLPFLLAGACTVWMTGRVASVLFPGRARVAWLASAIVACDLEVLTLARRSTPDVLLVLATTASLYGLARIVVAREPGAAPRAWFWIGAAAMIATKGGLGLVMLAFAAACAIALRARGVRARDFVDVPSILVAAGVAALGFAAHLGTHDRPAADGLFEDQVATRIVGSLPAAIAIAGDYASSTLKRFAPWLLLLVVGAISAGPALRERWRRDRRSFAFALGWFAIACIVFLAANTHRARYLAPTHPAIACALAAGLVEVASARAVGRLVRASLAVVAAVAALAALAVARIDVATSASCALTASIALVCVFLCREEDDAREPERRLRARVEPTTALAGLALSLLAVYAVAGDAVRALIDPSPLPEAVARLERDPTRSLAVLDLRDPTAGHLRVLSHGTIDATPLAANATDSDVLAFDALLVPAQQGERLRSLGYELERCGTEVESFGARSAWRYLTARDPRSELETLGEPVFLARRREATASDVDADRSRGSAVRAEGRRTRRDR